MYKLTAVLLYRVWSTGKSLRINNTTADGDTQSSDAEEEDDEEHGTISCGGCGRMMNDSTGSTWYKCPEQMYSM